MSESRRRVALVNNAKFYVGPPLARLLAARAHDLVLGDPADALVPELEALGATVEVVTGVHDLAQPESAQRLVDAGLARFGRIDSAAVVPGCLEAPYHFLKATAAAMKDNGDGQILLITSASGGPSHAGRPAVFGGAGGGHDARAQRGQRDGEVRPSGQRRRHELHGFSGVPSGLGRQ